MMDRIEMAAEAAAHESCKWTPPYARRAIAFFLERIRSSGLDILATEGELKMLTNPELRLECLRLARSNFSATAKSEKVLQVAKQYEEFVTGGDSAAAEHKQQ